MSDELDVINAALRLGDPAIPPKGALLWLERPPIGRVWSVTGRRERILGHTAIGLRSADGRVPVGSHYFIRRWDGVAPTVPTIVDVPRGAPPFGEWERVEL